MRPLVSACLFASVAAACAAPPSVAPRSTMRVVTSPLSPNLMTLTITPGEARQRLNALWGTLDKPSSRPGDPKILWDMALAPPLPMMWPPAPGIDWVRYAYAYGRDVRLADGTRVARPWATLTLHADGSATLAQLTAALEDGAVQGIIPVGQEQRDILQTGEAAQTSALALTALPDPASPLAQEIKAYYRLWVFFNGAIANLVRANHAPFFAWLDE